MNTTILRLSIKTELPISAISEIKSKLIGKRKENKKKKKKTNKKEKKKKKRRKRKSEEKEKEIRKEERINVRLSFSIENGKRVLICLLTKTRLSSVREFPFYKRVIDS